MAYYIIYSYNYVDNIYVIAWIISGILILSLQLTTSLTHGESPDTHNHNSII